VAGGDQRLRRRLVPNAGRHRAETSACGLSARRRSVRLPSGRRHAKGSRCGRRNPEHARYRGAVDASVEHPDAQAIFKRREPINATAYGLPYPPSPQVQKSAAISALLGGAKSRHSDRDRRTAPFDPMIGIGGHLAVPPLPPHRAYGSVPRRFDRVKLRQRHGVGGDRVSRNSGCAGLVGPPGVRTCARAPSVNRRRPLH
jgi:hypothetical protein